MQAAPPAVPTKSGLGAHPGPWPRISEAGNHPDDIMIWKERTTWKAPMESSPITEMDTEHLTVADFDASTGENPDPTGDFASGRTRIFLDSNEFLAFLDYCHQSATEE